MYGVPRGSVLDPILLFIFYDLCVGRLLGQVTGFSDDTEFLYTGNTSYSIQLGLKKL